MVAVVASPSLITSHEYPWFLGKCTLALKLDFYVGTIYLFVMLELTFAHLMPPKRLLTPIILQRNGFNLFVFTSPLDILLAGCSRFVPCAYFPPSTWTLLDHPSNSDDGNGHKSPFSHQEIVETFSHRRHGCPEVQGGIPERHLARKRSRNGKSGSNTKLLQRSVLNWS